MNRIIRGRVDRRPGRATIVGGGDEGVPLAREAYRLVIAPDISAGEADRRAAGAAADCFDLRCVLDAVRGADVEVVCPVNSIADAMTDYNSSVTFWRIASCYRLVVNVGIIDGAV